VEKPLGVFTASPQGISTARDVSTGNTAITIGADGLIDAKYALKAQYRKSAQWIFHRDAIKMIRKLKDGNGDYLWKAGLSDKPDTILELPFNESEYAPNTFTTGLYAGILGNFKFYWIADALNMQVQRLVELYAATNQTGFIGRLESDGMPVMEEAFVRVKLG
ncbi:phage major capsid protein, partial [Desulfosporosinus fructosivorans]